MDSILPDGGRLNSSSETEDELFNKLFQFWKSNKSMDDAFFRQAKRIFGEGSLEDLKPSQIPLHQAIRLVDGEAFEMESRINAISWGYTTLISAISMAELNSKEKNSLLRFIQTLQSFSEETLKSMQNLHSHLFKVSEEAGRQK